MESFSGHEDESTGAGLLGPGRGAVRTSVFWRKLATGSEYDVQFADPKKEVRLRSGRVRQCAGAPRIFARRAQAEAGVILVIGRDGSWRSLPGHARLILSSDRGASVRGWGVAASM